MSDPYENSGRCAPNCRECFHYDADPCAKHAYKRPETDIMLVYLFVVAAAVAAFVCLVYPAPGHTETVSPIREVYRTYERDGSTVICYMANGRSESLACVVVP